MKQLYWNNNIFQDSNEFMKEVMKKSLALKVKALRESKDLTQEDLADKCDVSWRTISNLERGLVMPDLYMLYKISKVFDVGIDEMLSLELDESKSLRRLEREQYIFEKIKRANDNVLDYLLDQIMLLFKYFN